MRFLVWESSEVVALYKSSSLQGLSANVLTPQFLKQRLIQIHNPPIKSSE